MLGSDARRLPGFESLDQLVEFFDTQDMGDYWDAMPEAQFDVDLTKRAFSIDAELADRVARIARARQTSSADLINAWLREKCLEHA